MLNEEEAIPLRPMTKTSHFGVLTATQIPATATIFGLSDEGKSEVQEASRIDEMNDTGLVELVNGIRNRDVLTSALATTELR